MLYGVTKPVCEQTIKFVMHSTSVDVQHEHYNLSVSSVLEPNVSHNERQGDDGPSVEILKQLMASWQECRSISKEYLPDKVVVLNVIDHNQHNIVSYFQDLYSKIHKKQLTMDQFIVKGQKRKVSDASKGNSKRAGINKRQ